MKQSSHPRVIFVFGSNLAGRHGKGAALCAKKYWGAVYGQAEGLQGNSYGIATKNSKLVVRTLSEIRGSVQEFLDFAAVNDDQYFMVTRIGCGHAGYTDEQIGPMFKNATENVFLPKGWGRMSFVDMAIAASDAVEPTAGESAESLATRMFNAQSSFLDSCSTGVGGSFSELRPEFQELWIRKAQKRLGLATLTWPAVPGAIGYKIILTGFNFT